ncbi:uncharacterized protein LOC134533746 [Bacillus rossius redtenbacheri]|uniref:uncharacterized protein LOC134533746 n=1 Tax=Bacillus rossius redtenbacheri TaxID=93214 RepID=UPI002FDC94FD
MTQEQKKWFEDLLEPPSAPFQGDWSERRKAMADAIIGKNLDAKKITVLVDKLLEPNINLASIGTPGREERKWIVNIWPIIYGQDRAVVGLMLKDILSEEMQKKHADKDISQIESLDSTNWDEQQLLFQAEKLVKDLTYYSTTEISKVNKSATNYMLPRIVELKGLVDRVLLDNAKMKGIIETQQQMASRAVTAGPTYSSTLISGKIDETTEWPMLKPKKEIVFVLPEKEDQTSEGTKKDLLRIINPIKEKMQFQSIRKISRGGILIESEDKETIAKLLKDERFKKSGIRVEKPKSRGPKIIIFDVPKEYDSKNFSEDLYEQNLSEMDISKEEFIKDFQVRTKRVRKDNTDRIHMIVEITPKIRSLLKRKSSIYIGFSSCHFKDFISVSRCYKCQSYGHIASKCHGNLTCSICSEQGHKYQECGKKQDGDKCINCRKENREYCHRVDSTECPVYKRFLKKEQEKITYE